MNEYINKLKSDVGIYTHIYTYAYVKNIYTPTLVCINISVLLPLKIIDKKPMGS